jgi:hypothetical protein
MAPTRPLAPPTRIAPTKRRAALAFYAAALTIVALALVQRAATTTLLSSRDVMAYAHKLDRLRAATRATGDDPRDRVQVTWTLASRCGDYRALALLAQWRREAADGEPETHLAARLDVERAGLPPRHPGRPPRPVWRLQRDDLASDLAGAGGGRRLELRLELPRGAAGEPAPPALAIDNLAAPAGNPLASAADPAFAFAAVPHCKASAADLRTLGALARLLRARVCGAGSPAGCVDSALLLYPDVHAGRYRIEVLPLAGERGSLRLRLEVTAEGISLQRGELSLLPESDLGAPAYLWVTPAKPPGEYLRGDDPGVAAYAWDPRSRRLSGPDAIDFATLLATPR